MTSKRAGEYYGYYLERFRQMVGRNPELDKEFKTGLMDKIFEAETYIEERLKKGEPIVREQTL